MSTARRRAAVLGLAALLGACAATPGMARADHRQVSVFQDDDHLIYNSTATVRRTLATLASLGVQQLRITVKWSAIAPAANSSTRPANFDAADPAAYPPSAWAPYDRIVELAAQRRIVVDFNVTAPGPLWAMATGTPTARAANHWAPSAREFASFVVALGVRYSGSYRAQRATIPRVNFWSIWNEPNQPGWLAPQWQAVGARQVLVSAQLYRRYLDSAYLALYVTGHLAGHDTVLIGELAPEGYTTPGVYTASTPMQFLRALYCVDRRYHRLRGAAAADLGCPTGGSRRAFVDANPPLFYATGFAHHPYYFFLAPGAHSPDPNFVPIGDLPRLERGLDRAFAAYHVARRLPLYLTEYGYQTDPPDPYQRVTPVQQAQYLNQADYMAWRDPRVRSVAQFLLYDARPDTSYASFDPQYWDTFQTGLRFASGAAKPAFAAYRLPIWLPRRSAGKGGTLLVWGEVRPAWSRARARAVIQWRPRHGRYRTIAVVALRGGERGYFTARLRPPASGFIRFGWRSPTGTLLMSRSVPVTMRSG